MRSKTPLALLSLTHDRRGLLSSVVGVSFAVMLMFVQLAFLNGIYDSSAEPLKMLDADLVMVNKSRLKVCNGPTFPRARLLQALEFKGVEEVQPLYISLRALWRSLQESQGEWIRVFAFDPAEPALLVPDLHDHLGELRLPNTVLFDVRSRDVYGGPGAGTIGELGGRRTRIVGEFELGPDLEVHGNLIMSQRNFQTYFGASSMDRVALGLIRVSATADFARLSRSMSEALPRDVDVLTKRELVERDRRFIRNSTPVGEVFGLGLVVAFAIGVMTCYQVLFTDVVDQLPQLATLKAIGYGNGYLLRLSLEQGVYLAVAGFVVALPGSLGAYWILQDLTGLQMALTFGRAFAIFATTVVMCALAAVLAARKVVRLDPAEVF
jgi:putative ABC transport system permease protein